MGPVQQYLIYFKINCQLKKVIEIRQQDFSAITVLIFKDIMFYAVFEINYIMAYTIPIQKEKN